MKHVGKEKRCNLRMGIRYSYPENDDIDDLGNFRLEQVAANDIFTRAKFKNLLRRVTTPQNTLR